MTSTPEKVRCSHILLSWDKALHSTHSRELVFAIHDAKQIIEDLQKGTITWKIAVKEHSACLESWQKGGDLGWFPEHVISPEIWSACLATPIDALFPEPIISPYGVHIIYRTG